MKLLLGCLLSALVFVFSSVFAEDAKPTAAATKPNIKAFGNWGLLCKDRVIEKPECHIFQNLSVKDSKKPVLHFAVGYVGDHDEPVAVLTLPLGVSLRVGVKIQVDEEKPALAPFEYCDQVGCRVNMRIPEKSLEMMKKGKQMMVSFADLKRKEIKLPLSMEGFTDAFNAMDAKR
jgi:invasion protein IalB